MSGDSCNHGHDAYLPHTHNNCVTVDGESFAGLNFCGFDPMKYFVEILSRFIGQECLCYIDNY